MDNHESILQKASIWMLARGWKQKIAKRKQFDQSLFEHTLVELDVALQLFPILKSSKFDISSEEEQILIASIIAHDVGKERKEWQNYILGKSGFVSDVDPELTRNVLKNLCEALDFRDLDQEVIAVIENCVNLHMSHERHDANVISALFQGNDRWYTLANLVYHIDNICSAKGVFESKIALERSLLAKHLKISYHHVIIRGVSTTALHRAALESFEEVGWKSLLHFSDSTIYVCSAVSSIPEPTPEMIETRMVEILRDATGRDVTQFIVGSPTANIMPKPELFDFRELRMYLEAATKKIGRKSFITIYEREKKNLASGKKATSGRGKSKAKVIEDYWKLTGRSGNKYSPEMDRDAERISNAQPEMVAFKFFKAAMKSDFIGVDGSRNTQKEYDTIFGSGSWSALLSTSTLMPDKDMANTVDIFWKLPGQNFNIAAKQIEELAPEKRTALLVDVLTKIANKVYEEISNKPSRIALARKMAARFIQDLVHPALQVDMAERAKTQMEFYYLSKPFAGKQTKKARYICPICNSPFEEGSKASSDLIDKPESHTNRGISHGQFGYITVCNTCKYERILRQLLLGKRASELIVIFPRMNIGPGAGELLVRKAQSLYDKSYIVMVGDTEDPDKRLWLAFTSIIASQVLDQDLYKLESDQLVNMLTYRSGKETRQSNERKLKKALMDAYDNDLESVNEEWGTDFPSWEAATTAVYSNKVVNPTAKEIRSEIYKLYPQMRLVCQTPHMILFPISYPIKLDKDSETNAALRRTFIALILG
ncbi:MAG: hypothetical protein NTZ38_00960, partial [Candidatus Taylorbacteria bacterium]|nr:hypothetical protein [Candidatus Taylorbacteria bacterium]